MVAFRNAAAEHRGDFVIGQGRGRARAASPGFWIGLAAAVCAIKTVMLLIDHQPLFTLGDSAVYLETAFGGNPMDRSFAYGRSFIRPLLWLFGSLDSVVIAQAALSAGCAMMIAAILSIGFAANRWTIVAAALAYTIEPLALLYERMIMTEAVTLFLFAAFLLLGILYLRQPRFWLLFGVAALSAACVAMRTSLVPVLVGLTMMLPPLALLRRWPLPRVDVVQCLKHLAVALALTFCSHALYQQWFHRVTGHPRAYTGADGLFLIASWAPLVTRADFPDPALFDRVWPTLGIDPSDRLTRPGQRFAPAGLVGRLIQVQHDEWSANILAKDISLNAGRRDPLGVLALGWQTYRDFWNPDVIAHVISVDEGQKEVDSWLIDYFRDKYGEDISGRHLVETLVKYWHRQTRIWYLFVLLTPVVGLIGLALNPRYWRPTLLISSAAMGTLLIDCLLVTEPVVRYLHGLAWVTILLCGALAQAVDDLVPSSGGAPENAVKH